MHGKLKLYRKRILLAFVVIIGILLAWYLMAMIFNPMRRPAPLIRLHVLWHTPIGMDMEDVIEIIENRRRWGDPAINRSNGFRHPSRFVEGSDGRPTAAIVGDQSVQTRVGIYHMMPFHERTLHIFWGFDEDGKLIEVYVRSGFAPRLV